MPAINFLSLFGLSAFFTYFWKIALLVIKFLISIFDSPLRIYYPTAFWPQLFSDEKIQLLHISGLPSMWYIVFLLLLSSISLCLTNFNYDVSHCECECFCIYHTWRLIGFLDMVIFFIKLRTFNYFFSKFLNVFCPFLVLLSFYYSHYLYVDMFNDYYLRLAFFYSFFFFIPLIA